MKYIIAASVSTDDIYKSDGTHMSNIPGGAGFYALCGIRLFSKNVIIIGGVGPSYFKMHKQWYIDNEVSIDALAVRCDDSITRIDYRQTEDRTDNPSNGLWEFRKRDPSLEEVIANVYSDTQGIYTFRHYDPEFLHGLLKIREKTGCRLMWEISEDACTEENRLGIEEILKDIDIFSINRHEMCLLYGTSDQDEAFSNLTKAVRHLAYVRYGADGAKILDNNNAAILHWPACTSHAVVDTTGCGNASTAGFLYGVCEAFPIEKAASCAAVAASYVLAQFGPPKFFSEQVMEEAKMIVEKNFSEYRSSMA